ncbi:MAG: hypothetical protein P4L27_08995 [Ignavibacteriaceae bacterium]|nr:hypothetical protein [Ignavibacteriaceae bacterium]
MKYSFKNFNDIYKAVVLIYLVSVTDLLLAYFNINFPLLRYFFATVGVFYFARGIISTMRNFQSGSLKYAFILLFILTMIMIARGMPVIWEGKNNYVDLKTFISGQLFVYLLPMIVFSEPNLYLLKKIFRFGYLLAVFYILVTVIFWSFFTRYIYNGSESMGVLFAAGSSILLLTQSYHSIRIRRVTVITFILVLFMNLLFARRNQVLYFSTIILFTILIHIFSRTQFAKKRKEAFLFGFIIVSIFITAYLYFANSQFTFFYERAQTGMQSREDAINNFMYDYSINPNDFIMGRGINGLIYNGTSSTGSGTLERAGIENGYLLHILKGGWVYLGLLLLITIPAIYLGFFQSKNILSKASAAIVFAYLIDMIGFGVPTLTLKHLMIWIGVSLCYSPRIRSYTDEYLKSVIGLK